MTEETLVKRRNMVIEIIADQQELQGYLSEQMLFFSADDQLLSSGTLALNSETLFDDADACQTLGVQLIGQRDIAWVVIVAMGNKDIDNRLLILDDEMFATCILNDSLVLPYDLRYRDDRLFRVDTSKPENAAFHIINQE